MTINTRSGFAFALFVAAVAAQGAIRSPDHDGSGSLMHTVTVVTEPFSLESKYASMEGPSNRQNVFLLDAPEPELLWITAIEANIVDARDDSAAMPPQLMCHANLDMDVSGNAALASWYKQLRPTFTPRVFTLAQGQRSISFPQGFGIPVRSDASLRLWTQVLNAYDDYIGSEIRQKITFTFVRESERTAPMTPLRFVFSESRVSLDDAPAYYSLVSHKDHVVPITGAAVEGFPAVAKGEAADHTRTPRDGLGRQYSSHWIVPPGRNEIHTVMNKLMNLTEDIDIHYIAAHLHPYATSIEIRDLTTQSSLFYADVESSSDGKALTKIHNFSSDEPLTLQADHDYDFISIYENTSGEDVTAMAVVHLYVAFDEFDAERYMARVSQ